MATETLKTIDLDAGRRAFIRHVGLVSAGLGVLGVTTLQSHEAHAQTLTDVNILNFALNLEYLEAEFYLRAAFGRGLADNDITGKGTQGNVLGGRQVDFPNGSPVGAFAKEIAGDEEAHVKFLRGALGAAKVARPRLDLRNSFTKAARAAGLIGNGQQFDPYANEINFLLAAFIFEDVGVTAYKGAARFIDNKDYLEAAAGILAVEAYHAGEIRTLLYQRGAFDQTKAISKLRDTADGAGNRDEPIKVAGKANIVPTDANGVAFSRTPDQVLNIVYLGGEAAGFGFFPNKLNGPIK